MTQTDERGAAHLHRREVLNTIIDLLESIPDRQQQTAVIVSAAAAIGVNVTLPRGPVPRSGVSPTPKRKRNW